MKYIQPSLFHQLSDPDKFLTILATWFHGFNKKISSQVLPTLYISDIKSVYVYIFILDKIYTKGSYRFLFVNSFKLTLYISLNDDDKCTLIRSRQLFSIPT